MAKKETKLQQITNQSQQQTKRVFNTDMFNRASSTGIAPKTENYTYVSIELGNINYNKSDAENHPLFIQLLNSIKNGRLVNPVILSYEYTVEERAGREFRNKTGKYNVVDGNTRVGIYNKLFNEAVRNDNQEDMEKYASISALLLPLNVSNDEIDSIKKTTELDKSISTKNVIKDITETKNEQISYCYRYEAAEIPLDKIVGRENKYKFTQNEIDELEKSIYLAGLMQPIILLPKINTRTMEVEYEIEAGHKRTTAIRQLVQRAKEGEYSNPEVIIDAYKTVPSLLIPMGATPEQVEKIYNDTNILTRHMSTSDVFEHIKYFEEMPSRPTTKIEFVDFKEKKYKISNLSNILQKKFKMLGFSDWKNRQTSRFLNIYYYGSDKCLEMFNNIETHDLTQKDLEWIAITNKDFNERKKQDEILEKSKNNKAYFLSLKDDKVVKKTPQKIKIRKMTENVLKQKNVFDKMVITPFDLNKADINDVKNAEKTLIGLEKSISEMKERLKKIKGEMK